MHAALGQAYRRIGVGVVSDEVGAKPFTLSGEATVDCRQRRRYLQLSLLRVR